MLDAQPKDTLIAFENVELTLGGRLILTGIDVSIRKGEFLSVVVRRGAARLLCSISRPGC